VELQLDRVEVKAILSLTTGQGAGKGRKLPLVMAEDTVIA
jgi:hypothetical protein